MKNTRRKSFSQLGIIILILFIIMLNIIFPTLNLIAKAENLKSPKYCDDGFNSDEIPISLRGEGASYNDNQTIYYDSKVVTDNHIVGTAPTYGNGDPSMTDVCAPMAGTNSIVFYDRWFPNLIPDFEPGMINGGYYQYFPDVAWPQVETLVKDLYRLMRTNVGLSGTSRADFKAGLTTYVNQHGYNLSYLNFKQDTKNVNLSTFANAIANHKVGVLFCKSYNFIYSINDISNGEILIVKRNSTIGHMMMAYGYKIVAYYKNGINFRTDTYLQVSSGYGGAEQGYILMNEFVSLDDALILTIS